MYKNCPIEIPEAPGRISRKNLKGVTYVYYQYDRIYNPEKKYSVPQCTTIGKCCEGSQTHMYQNENYVKYFPELAISELKGVSNRLGYIKLGSYVVLEKLVKECKLDSVLGAILGDESVQRF